MILYYFKFINFCITFCKFVRNLFTIVVINKLTCSTSTLVGRSKFSTVYLFLDLLLYILVADCRKQLIHVLLLYLHNVFFNTLKVFKTLVFNTLKTKFIKLSKIKFFFISSKLNSFFFAEKISLQSPAA